MRTVPPLKGGIYALHHQSNRETVLDLQGSTVRNVKSEGYPLPCQKWKIEQISDNLSDGYSVKNMAEGTFLGVQDAERAKDGMYTVAALDRPYSWFVVGGHSAQGGGLPSVMLVPLRTPSCALGLSLPGGHDGGNGPVVVCPIDFAQAAQFWGVEQVIGGDVGELVIQGLRSRGPVIVESRT